MTETVGERLYLLSFGHPSSVEKELMGTKGAPPAGCAVLVDEDFGADVASGRAGVRSSRC